MSVDRACRAACLAVAAALAACAASVETVPTAFVATAGGEFTLTREVTVTLATRYSRALVEGSRWRKVGAVAEGDVYRAIGTVFTIEGRNVHEAYLVIAAQHRLVGFYLPGESNLSLLPAPVELPIKENP